MEIYVSNKDFIKNVEDISIFLKAKITFDIPKNKGYLSYDEDGLSYIKDASNPRERLHIDFLKGKLAWRVKRSQHEGNIKKALGKHKRTLFIFDAKIFFLSVGNDLIFLNSELIIPFFPNISEFNNSICFISLVDFNLFLYSETFFSNSDILTNYFLNQKTQ